MLGTSILSITSIVIAIKVICIDSRIFGGVGRVAMAEIRDEKVVVGSADFEAWQASYVCSRFCNH